MSPLLLTLSSMQGGKHVPLITDTLLMQGGVTATPPCREANMSPLLLTLSSMQGGKHIPLVTDTLLHAGRQTCPPYY